MKDILKAHQQFTYVLWSYRVALAGAQLVATADSGRLEALLKVASGFNQKPGLYGDPNEIKAAAELEMARNFSSYRQSAIIQACAAIEGLWKTTFVECALSDAAILERFELRLSIPLTDIVGVSDAERLYAAAAEAYERKPSRGGSKWRHFDRHVYLVENILSGDERRLESAREWLDLLDERLFNEAFAVRNCIIHHSAHANGYLSQHGRFQRGQKIVLTGGLIDKYLENLEYLATFYIDKIGLAGDVEEGAS